MPVKINGSTSGSVTLAAPATGSDVTLTLPTLGFGKVLQVVQGTYSTTTVNDTSTWADTGLTASITPSSTSSKVLVIVSQAGVEKRTGNTSVGLRLLRGATTLQTFETYAGNTNSTTLNNVGTCMTVYLDSPSTTSATAYKTQLNSQANTAQASCQRDSATSSIILVEVAP